MERDEIEKAKGILEILQLYRCAKKLLDHGMITKKKMDQIEGKIIKLSEEKFGVVIVKPFQTPKIKWR